MQDFSVVKQDFSVVKQYFSAVMQDFSVVVKLMTDNSAPERRMTDNSAPELAEHSLPPTRSCWIHPCLRNEFFHRNKMCFFPDIESCREHLAAR
jgi:hypothetical protein